MNYQRKKLSLLSDTLPTITERRVSRRSSPLKTEIDDMDNSPEFKKLKAFMLEAVSNKQRLSDKFKLFKPLDY